VVSQNWGQAPHDGELDEVVSRYREIRYRTPGARDYPGGEEFCLE
jgi:hypothetical protein